VKRIEEKLEKLKNEAVIYLQLEHPNIARLFDVYEDHHEVGEVWMGDIKFQKAWRLVKSLKRQDDGDLTAI